MKRGSFIPAISCCLMCIGFLKASDLDWGDLPDATYPTKLTANGPRHLIIPGIYLGGSPPDAEADGQPDSSATGDDLAGSADEDGFNPTTHTAYPGFPFTIHAKATSGVAGPVKLRAFADWNHDGDFDDAGESGVTTEIGPFSDRILRVTLDVPPAAVTTLPTALRLRFSTDVSLLQPVGYAKDGEVEDYLLTVSDAFQGVDFGDLPAGYPNKLPGGAFHRQTAELFIGNSPPDTEVDGNESSDATGDDFDGADDEDALAESNPVLIADGENRLKIRVKNNTGEIATLWGFADWNHDGDFADAGESASVVVRPAIDPQVAVLRFQIPPNPVLTSPAFIRLRLSFAEDLGPGGAAGEGEVEDGFAWVRESGTLVDHGDLPDTAPGTAPGVHGSGSPPDYKTLLADGGPSHPLIAGLGFANRGPTLDSDFDGEADGLPVFPFDDGTDHNDDLGFSSALAFAVLPEVAPRFDTLTDPVIRRDGIHTEIDIVGLFNSEPYNALPLSATAHWFIDTNHNGTFDDPTDAVWQKIFLPNELRDSYGDGVEHIGSYVVGFNATLKDLTPGTNFAPLFAVRQRISTATVLDPYGPAPDGEVEDHVLPFPFTVPENTFDNPDYGDLPWPYPTQWADSGARHLVDPDVFLGLTPPDGEVDGLPSTAADGDNSTESDDEDGLIEAGSLVPIVGQPFTMGVRHTNLKISQSRIVAFVDWNADGDFDDAEENVVSPAIVGPIHLGVEILHFNVPPDASTTQPVAVRLRLSTDLSISSPSGLAKDGEVEDYFLNVHEGPQDYGDLPTPYATTYAKNGARHAVVPGLFIGSEAPDVELDPTQDATATGDDTIASDDEDGITLAAATAYAGVPYHFAVNATNNTFFDAIMVAFIDWNQDGDFDDVEESSSVTVPQHVGGGSRRIFHFNVPPDAVTTAPTAVRLRLTTDNFVLSYGAANDGEVEDGYIQVSAPAFDWSDLPDATATTGIGEWGTTSPPDYQTLSANNGPSHQILPGLNFANDIPGSPDRPIDSEADGQPTNSADGDNVNGDNDESPLISAITRQTTDLDGPRTYSEIELFTSLAVENITGSDAYVHGFIDVNSDGDFNDPGEQSPVIAVPGDGSADVVEPKFTFNLNLPPSSTTPLTFGVRFRISADPLLTSEGPANEGEVEDGFVSATFTIGSYPINQDWGDLGAPYSSTLADNGPRHGIIPELFLGSAPPDAEINATPSALANADDSADADDEDGLDTSTISAYQGLPVSLPVSFTNTTTGNCEITAFIDWDVDGSFTGPLEEMRLTGGPGITNGTMTFTPTVPLNASTSFPVPVRLRLSTGTELGPDGPAPDGEVEDHLITILQPLDFGDLPSPYPTLLANDGARHYLSPGLFMGASGPDVEADGQAANTAEGDDENGADDEDTLLAGYVEAHSGFDLHLQVQATNSSTNMAYLRAFADWNADGDFNDENENTEVNVPPGSISAPFNPVFHVPFNTVTAQPVAVRLRLSSLKGIGPHGLAPNGEVEDYFVAAPKQIIDFGDLNDVAVGTTAGVVTDFNTISQGDYLTRLSEDGPRHRARQDLNLNNDLLPADSTADGTALNPLPVHVDGEADAHPTTGADGDDNDRPSAPNGGVLTPPAFPGDDDEAIFHSAVIKQTFDPSTMKLFTALFGSIAVRNQTGSPAYLTAFLDANNDGDFSDPDETPLTVGQGPIFGIGPNFHPSLNANYETIDTVVPSVVDGSTVYGFVFVVTHQLPLTDTGIRGWTVKLPLRIRLSTSAGLGPNGINANNSIPDGEVEDYLVSWTAGFDSPYPSTAEGLNSFDPRDWSRLIDRNSTTRFYGSLHFAGNPSQSFNDQWNFGEGNPLFLQEQNPLVPPFLLNYLGLGTVPYLHTAQFGDGGIGSYLGYLTIRDLGDYRSFMDQAKQTGEDSVPMGDIDGDGITNFHEYAFGSDPASAASIFKLEHRVMDDPGGGPSPVGKYFVAAYLRRTGGSFSGAEYSTSEVHYIPQGTVNLGTWDTPLEVPVSIPPDLPTAPSGYEWGAVRFTNPITNANPRGFIRMLADPP